MKFKDNLRKLRKENNLSQEKLAEKLNISRQAISKWESGKAYPDIDNLILLRDIFNVSLDELVVNERIDKEEIISEENYIDSDNKCSYEAEENEEDDDDDITNFMFIGFIAEQELD
ncbi:MAG: helix-turn-helix transcriptional regulator [Clostridium sartagoforme]|nr:helix-turn-helix transcriptional regulator [Clostridium sartagoforme]